VRAVWLGFMGPISKGGEGKGKGRKERGGRRKEEGKVRGKIRGRGVAPSPYVGAPPVGWCLCGLGGAVERENECPPQRDGLDPPLPRYNKPMDRH